MIDENCLGPDVDPSKIHPDAEICGASYLTGAKTTVAAGAVVRDSRLHNVAVDPGAEIIDSIILPEGEAKVHSCDSAGRRVVTGAESPEIGASARIEGSTLVNTSVGAGCVIKNTFARDARFGPDNRIRNAKIVITNTDAKVTVSGPTEISEAWLGKYTTIEQRGYYEGVFSNAFRQLKFDNASGELKITGTIELPHLSRYGLNTINSTNSGRLLPQPEGRFTSFGPHRGLWTITLLSHEPVELGPCCWVAPWTKVIGQSALPHQDDESLVNDRQLTYLMPFSIAGVGAGATTALVMPGELSLGYGPKKRKGAWVFTYAPDLVIRMVARLHEALPPERKVIADTIVVEALKTAIEITRAMAYEHKVDLSAPLDQQSRGWPQWIAKTYALLRAHLDHNLWEFKDGKPLAWKLENNRWTHPNLDRITALQSDALEKQLSEAEIFATDDPIPPVKVALPAGELHGTGGKPEVAPGARVSPDAFVGPGCIIGAGCEIAAGAEVWNSILADCRIESGARVWRSEIRNASLGADSAVRSSRLVNSTLGGESLVECAALTDSELSRQTTASAFANLKKVRSTRPAIFGGAFHHTSCDAAMMSMHMAGWCEHLRILPSAVKVDGRPVGIPAIPMIGGGAQIKGTAENPVEMQCSFIASNALIEAGAYLGFGSFVLGKLGGGEGLLPFTVSPGGGVGSHQIGGVLVSMSNIIITHFISWTYQAVAVEDAPAVARMVTQAIQTGIDAIQWELERRASGKAPAPGSPYAKYKSLAQYSEPQLKSGLSLYRKILRQGAWELNFNGRELVFLSEKGHWIESQGKTLWQPNS